MLVDRGGHQHHAAGFLPGHHDRRLSGARLSARLPGRSKDLLQRIDRLSDVGVLERIHPDGGHLRKRRGLVELLYELLDEFHRVRRGGYDHRVRSPVGRNGGQRIGRCLGLSGLHLGTGQLADLVGAPGLRGPAPAPWRGRGRGRPGGLYRQAEQLLEVVRDFSRIGVYQREHADLADHGGERVELFHQRVDYLEVDRLGPDDHAARPHVGDHADYRRGRRGGLPAPLDLGRRGLLGIEQRLERLGDGGRVAVRDPVDAELRLAARVGLGQAGDQIVDLLHLGTCGRNDQRVGGLVDRDGDGRLFQRVEQVCLSVALVGAGGRPGGCLVLRRGLWAIFRQGRGGQADRLAGLDFLAR